MQILGISYLIWWLLSIWGIGIYFLTKVCKLRLMYKNVDLKSSGADADVQLIKFLSIMVMILASLFSLLLLGKNKHSDSNAFISGAYVGLSVGLIYVFVFFLALKSKLQKQSNGLSSSFKELEKKIEEEKRKIPAH